ncbi:MAG: hypothetical protein KDD66_00930 [Bdellovibrionales bacterium]|nr:hypothetical protein [Bdellovibrionales bacterium]
MTQATSNDPAPTARRIHALDFLRGVYIIFACGQHYAALLSLAGIPMEGLLLWLFWVLTPSGDQVFLALASFNLARRDQSDFNQVWRGKVLVFFTIFCMFVVEGFFRALEPDQALIWGPMQTWMTVLILITVLRRILGWRGVAALFILQTFYWFTPVPELVNFIGASLSDNMFFALVSYDSPVELFIGSGCLGFLLGYYYYHGTHPQFKEHTAEKRLALLLVAGATALVPFMLYGTFWTIYEPFVWKEEYLVASQFSGILSIWGIITLIISTGLLIEHLIAPLKVPIVNWIGRYSLLIFAFHLVFFVRVIMPVHFYFGPKLGFPPINTFLMQCLYVFPMIFLCYLIIKSRLLLFMQRQGEIR